MRHRAQAGGPVLRGLRGSACCRVQSLANGKEEISVSSMGPSVRIDVLIEELSSLVRVCLSLPELPEPASLLGLSVHTPPAGQEIQILACDWARSEVQRRHPTAEASAGEALAAAHPQRPSRPDSSGSSQSGPPHSVSTVQYLLSHAGWKARRD